MADKDNSNGTATTAIAAIRESRHYVGFELDPAHFATAKRRIAEELRNPTLF